MVDKTDDQNWPKKAYKNARFLNSQFAREIRILSEYIEPEARFEELQVKDTVVFFGSARIKSRKDAEKKLELARLNESNIEKAERDLGMSRYYEDACKLSFRLTKWSKVLKVNIAVLLFVQEEGLA